MYDLVVIGGGSGGVRCARVAASLGATVALVERDALGGTCVNRGCVPKKLLVYGAEVGRSLARASRFGFLGVAPEAAHAVLRDAVRHEVDRLAGAYGRTLERAGVEVCRGDAQVIDPHTVRVGDRTLVASTLVVATGGVPIRPDFPGALYTSVSDDVFDLDALPRRVLVVGGGYIGVEMAGVFSGLGAAVTLVSRSPWLLSPAFDHEIRRFLGDQVRASGVDLRLGVSPLHVAPTDGGLEVVLEDHESVVADLVLAAVGRRPCTDGLGLEAVGVALGPRGEVVVDREFRSSVPSIRAIGDVIGGQALTPVATAQGMALAHHLVSGRPLELDLEGVPTAVFSYPPVATVGWTEESARAAGFGVEVYRSRFTPMKHAFAPGPATLVKLVVDGPSDRVLGVHMVGDDAAEIVQGFAVALKAGATKRQFDRTIGIHPTAAEELVTLRTQGG